MMRILPMRAAWLPMIAASLMPFTLAGCDLQLPDPNSTATPPPSCPPPPSKLLAHVADPIGDAFVRHGSCAEVRATAGMPIYSGDTFRTGPTGRMTLNTPDGGQVQVFENTDPIFEDAVCRSIRFFNQGRLFIFGKEFCVQGDYEQASQVGYQALGNGIFRIYVVEGTVRLRRTGAVLATTGQAVEVQNGRVLRRFTFTPAEVSRLFPRRVIIQ